MGKIVGIIGGMGPVATVKFIEKLTSMTDAEIDQDHVRYVLYNDPEIPDRIEAYFENMESPVNAINNGIKYLESIGIDTIGMACNTAHIWFKEFVYKSNFLNMIDLTASVLKKSGFKNVLLLSTNATVSSGLYTNKLKDYNINTVIPDQDIVMKSIHYVKVNDTKMARETIDPVINGHRNEVDALLLACTEMPVIISEKTYNIPVIDSDEALAAALIKSAGKRLKKEYRLYDL
ncbi:cysteate racemase [Picrophilus oshimae]|uniref:Aspartate racemase n=1 Tax=Picrophilus torridus (strain ATCC 700027 / DSM 9790 / JCM 10055 / NBRC 100828 / KAW 2/3) TaxID=1122961 RepID=A0A8G2FXW8_PICTO|nr:amino acid racemase [Picrophilus oshimae]SMD31522.1 aspartate racemase [Picrophilus oshimae DSM 9789]